MPLLVGMTEVSAQTTTPPTSDTVQPVVGAPLTAPVPPTGDNTTLNPNVSAVKMETLAGAGGGVDLEKMDTNAYERLMDSLPEEVDEVAPQGETTTSPSAATAAPAAASVAPTTAEVQPGTGEHEEGILAPGKLPARLKIPTDDALSFHTARLFKEARLDNRPMTLGEAEKLAMGILGMDASPSPATEPTGAAAPAPQKPADDLQTQLDAAITDFESNADSFTPAGQAAALRKITELQNEVFQRMITAQRDEAAAVTQQAAEQAAFLEQWQTAETRVHGMFSHANAADPASALHQRAAEIQASYRDSQDPAMQAIYNSPNSVLLYFTQAASELSIAPSAAAAPSAPPSLPKSTPPPVSRQVPVGAALLATPSGGNPAAFQGKTTYHPQSIHEYEQLVERMPAA